ncbi:MAG: type I-C CRISPR-associated protein Cas7/Csd2 [Candidatus Limiplasma sp.]|nr:type I-C CRISPR-associated protein Cas7/Csd2 [Candidatus Limiplasma sp.]
MAIEKRHDFILYFEVENGNPNGDPDAGNMPRIDLQTSHGIVTDVCLKRKVRNYVQTAYGHEAGYDIFVTEGAILNNKMKQTYEDYGLNPKQENARDLARDYMCKRFFDVRAFGAVMDTGDFKCGQVRGPAQFCFARSVNPIWQQEVTITRMAATSEKEAKAKEGDKDGGEDAARDATKNRTMGRKYVVPYALYRMEGFLSPAFAGRTGFDRRDLDILWEALLNMFEIDHSASRGRMATRKLIVFEHESALGNAPSYELFDLVQAACQCQGRPPRSFGDYAITLKEPPQGVTLRVLR